MSSSAPPIAFTIASIASPSRISSATAGSSGSRATATNGRCPSGTFDFFATSRSLPRPFTPASPSAACSNEAGEH